MAGNSPTPRDGTADNERMDELVELLLDGGWHRGNGFDPAGDEVAIATTMAAHLRANPDVVLRALGLIQRTTTEALDHDGDVWQRMEA